MNFNNFISSKTKGNINIMPISNYSPCFNEEIIIRPQTNLHQNFSTTNYGCTISNVYCHTNSNYLSSPQRNSKKVHDYAYSKPNYLKSPIH